jgi:hypothetical protein
VFKGIRGHWLLVRKSSQRGRSAASATSSAAHRLEHST